MDKKIAGLLGAAAALSVTAGAGAQAAPAQQTELAPATTYGDLLKPVPNAVAALREDEANRGQTEPAQVQLAQFFRHHHHHHHHHGFFHHHHHHGFFGGGVVIGPGVVGPGGCWAWGRPYWNGFRWVRRRIWVCD
jgi:hypothetical protein